MYLKIQNKGETPIESFTMFGLSSQRDKNNKLGRYGTGNKHAIAYLLRNGYNPTIFIGGNEVKFFGKNITFKDTVATQVCYTYNGETKETSNCAENGTFDWTSIDMALREFVSNALDNVESQSDVKIEVTSEAVAEPGFTTVYVELKPEVKQFYDELSQRFLQFRDQSDHNIIVKDEPSQAKFYRRGVYVRTTTNKRVSIFDYNDPELQIDECRNSDDTKCAVSAAKLLSKDVNALVAIFYRMNEQDWYEKHLYNWYLNSPELKRAFFKVYGESYITSDSRTYEAAKSKGMKCVLLPPEWCTACVSSGVKSADSYLSEVEKRGYATIPPNKELKRIFNSVWRKVIQFDMNNGKPAPKLVMFSIGVPDNTHLNGYQKGDTVYINSNTGVNPKTVLHEVLHYVSDADDCTESFQQVILKFATLATFGATK